MKKNFKNLIKRIIATSIAAIAGTHGAEAIPMVSFNESDLDLDIASMEEAQSD